MSEEKNNNKNEKIKKLNQDESDFMLEEYRQIYRAFSDLYPQKDQLLKFFLTIFTIASTALGTLLLFKSDQLSKIGITYINLELGARPSNTYITINIAIYI